MIGWLIDVVRDVEDALTTVEAYRRVLVAETKNPNFQRELNAYKSMIRASETLKSVRDMTPEQYAIKRKVLINNARSSTIRFDNSNDYR